MFEREVVEEQYNQAALRTAEHEKVMWASDKTMQNRFKRVLQELDFASVSSWLDVGCGTGAFQALVLNSFPQLQATGIDIAEQLLAFASNRSDTRNAEFVNTDFLEFTCQPVDLITCIGVLQKTSFSPADFFSKTVKLLNSGGTLFLDTKNMGWNKFHTKEEKPADTHEYFCVADLCLKATGAGMQIMKICGYLPRTNQIVKAEESDTIFIIAKKHN